MVDGGINVVAKINGKHVCESKAVYGGSDATRSGQSGGTWEVRMPNLEYKQFPVDRSLILA
jgi:hypothetical protein